MHKRHGAVTFQGNPLTLVGDELKVGAALPAATVRNKELQPVTLPSLLAGKVGIVVTVPSLDTSVCDIEVRKFNEKAASLSRDIAIVVVSMDLPFAQNRWCGAAGVASVTTVSDYVDGAFGLSAGILIEELHLLARSIFVVNRQGVVDYVQLVSEVTHEPDYAAVLAAAEKAVRS
jgi:thiol peroxidase